jgi:hypothetical protein
MNLKNNLFAIAALALSLSTASPFARADASSQKDEAQPNIESKRQTRRQAMPYRISTLLIRNLNDVFGENDPARRRAVIDEIFTEDCVFYDPMGGVYRGRDEIDRVAGTLRATHSDFLYEPIAAPEELGNAGRVKWVEGRPGEAPAVAGTDFIIAHDGRIAALYLFFDKVPEQYHLAAASFAHCQNFSAAGLRRPFGAAMPIENGFGSGMRCKSFTRFPKV